MKIFYRFLVATSLTEQRLMSHLWGLVNSLNCFMPHRHQYSYKQTPFTMAHISCIYVVLIYQCVGVTKSWLASRCLSCEHSDDYAVLLNVSMATIKRMHKSFSTTASKSVTTVRDILTCNSLLQQQHKTHWFYDAAHRQPYAVALIVRLVKRFMRHEQKIKNNKKF